MSRFDGRRVQATELHLDWEGLRRADYSDRYFWNGARILSVLAQEGYRFRGYSARLAMMGRSPTPPVATGDLHVEMQWFPRRKPFTVIAGTGGFNEQRIREFEAQGAPVDIYGVGSAFFSNSSLEGTNTDFTADVVRVEIDGEWLPLAKEGRAPCDNPLLEKVKF